MLWMLDPEAGPRAAFCPVVDLASGRTVGWELVARAPEAPPQWPIARSVEDDMLSVLVTTRPVVPAGHFVALRLSGRALADPGTQRLLRIGGRLDGVALLLRGPMNRDGLMLLEEARERGALVGCDTTAALVHFTALAPDVLSLAGPRAADRAVAVLAAIAATSGAKPLAHGVATAADAEALEGLGVALAQGDVLGAPEPFLPREAAKVSSAFFGRRRRGAGRVARANPSLPATEPVSAIVSCCLSSEEHDWVVLVDERTHPVRLVERAALLEGEPFEHRAVAIHPAMSLEDVARTALARPASDRSRPLAVCDAAGRYRGLLMIDAIPSVEGAYGSGRVH
jgi:hypothetical protein